MELINKDTKPCPNCGTLITKIIGGCDQMWCIDCHTAFSWNKGVIDKGVVHNPHFYEWQRNTTNGEIPRNPLDVPCGRNNNLPRHYTLLNSLKKNKIDNNSIMILSTIHNICTHIQFGLNNNNTNFDQELLNLRIKFLLDEISEEDWKKKIFSINKKKEKTTDFRNINEMFNTVCTESFYNIINNDFNEKNNFEITNIIITELTSLENLRIYFNDEIQKIGKRYMCVYPYIDKKYTYFNNAKKINLNN
jgi:hypothetical protein